MVQGDSRIHIYVMSASNLPPADANGKSDPYVVIKDVPGTIMEGQVLKTPVQKKTLNPDWGGYHFILPINYKLRKLVFQVFDWDALSKDDFLCKAKVNIDFLFDGQEHVREFPLLVNKLQSGSLKLKMKMEFAFPIVVPGYNLRIQESMLMLGIGWDTSKKSPVDLDASVIAFNGNRDLVDHVAFDKVGCFNGALWHKGDNMTGENNGQADDENVEIHLKDIPQNVEYLVIVINCLQKPLNAVKSAYVRLLGRDTKATLAFSRVFKSQDNQHRGMLLGYLRKDPASGWWTFYSRPTFIPSASWVSSAEDVKPLLFN